MLLNVWLSTMVVKLSRSCYKGFRSIRLFYFEVSYCSQKKGKAVLQKAKEGMHRFDRSNENIVSDLEVVQS